jgi:hypothetical protein
MPFRAAFKRLLAPIFNFRTSREVPMAKHGNQPKAWTVHYSVRRLACGNGGYNGGNDGGNDGGNGGGNDNCRDDEKNCGEKGGDNGRNDDDCVKNGRVNYGRDDDDGGDDGNDTNDCKNCCGNNCCVGDKRDARASGGIIMVLPMYHNGIHTVLVSSRFTDRCLEERARVSLNFHNGTITYS